MPSDDRPLIPAFIGFWCSVLSVVVAVWLAVHRRAVPNARLAPWAVLGGTIFVLHVVAVLRLVRRLPTMSPDAVQRAILTAAGVGLILLTFALTLP